MLTKAGRLLAVLLVFPLALVLMPQAALAAEATTVTIKAKVSVDGNFDLGAGFNCRVDAYYAGGGSHGVTVGGRLACAESSWELPLIGGTKSWNQGTTSVEFKSVGGASTGWATNAIGSTLEGGVSFSGSSVTLMPGDVVNQVCISGTYKREQFLFDRNGTMSETCVPFAMGTPPSGGVEPASCELATGLVQPEVHITMPQGGGVQRGYAIVNGQATGTATPGRVVMYIITSRNGNTGVGLSALQYRSAEASSLNAYYGTVGRAGEEAINLGNGATSEMAGNFKITAAYIGTPTEVTQTPVGVGYFVVPASSGNLSPNYFMHPLAATGGGDEDGKLGVNDPSACSFYWGAKLWSDGIEGEGADEPLGPLVLGDPPEPDPIEPPDLEPIPDPSDDACTFDITSPSTWLEGGMCAAVGLLGGVLDLLGQLLGAVAGLPAKLIGLLSDLFQTLVVPADGFLDGKIADLSDSMDGTTLGNYVGAFEGLRPSASGCQGPEFNIPIVAGTSSYPLSACDGAMATLAGTSRTILGISVGLAGGFACVRILGRGFGWDPGLGGER